MLHSKTGAGADQYCQCSRIPQLSLSPPSVFPLSAKYKYKHKQIQKQKIQILHSKPILSWDPVPQLSLSPPAPSVAGIKTDCCSYISSGFTNLLYSPSNTY